ncbi:acetamidase/formamidase family protein [Mycolicibacterium fluoranthenivorans]|jgi:acetamidase/formamidase|uniref:Acetamidase/formamidase n=1 Tax=Mycolicibacterium fluoranthenivorans TaxID=258505 RepID=A0A1G4WGB5_9MYCO|nr:MULTISPECIES: acetamidase/formamidase family protein [Mycobacteriaceae]MCV7252745.1 acetamidase/formamidase family protein [Mycobacterium hackensackense]MCV7355261.1 acetamidase/formamidase family protein [Mycolicibacterium fluoranthenivorans]NIH93955.1 acetamidase/formamidase [Mycolicibacterium fluoranthenivorans]QNJ94188.1 acetamidase/formamidase family protein [Mycolicibacterium fluoranthenivorans]SCX22460.1 Acetamidase/formamidase [Mycolicibacterium fluoranthenivorans]
MQIVEFTPTRDQYVWTFGGAEPALEVAPGTVLRLWTEDAFAGRVTSREDKPSQVLNPKELNPQTGPFYVTGAEPGDTLALHFVSIEPARDWAASTTIPLFGALTGTDRTATLQAPLPELTWIYQVDAARGTATFVAHESDFTVDLPLAPMLGTVGVAPALREVRTTLVPDYFGGNMDTPELRAGTTVYLGVNVEGALFSVGDGHYRQGEGETCGTALEGAMHVTLIVELIKGGAPAWPRFEHDDALLTVGSARPLEDAWRCSQVEMVRWLADLHGIGEIDAYQLCSQLCLSPLANVVDVNYSAVTKIPTGLLPAVSPYGGMHRRLRAAAATLPDRSG